MVWRILLFLMFFAVLTSSAVAGKGNTNLDAFEMFDQFDEQDKKIFNSLLEKAESCINKDDFECAEEALRKAKKYILSKKDSQRIDRLYAKLEEEKERKNRQESETGEDTVEIVRIDVYRHDTGGANVCVEYKINGVYHYNNCALHYFYDKGTYQIGGHYCGICNYFQSGSGELWCTKAGTLGRPSSLKEALALVIEKCVLR